MDGGTFNGNGGVGADLKADTTGRGKAKVVIDNVTANNNLGSHGLKVKANSERGGDAEVSGTNVTVNGNAKIGLEADAKTSRADKASIELEDLTAKNNGDTGADLKAVAEFGSDNAVIKVTGAELKKNDEGIVAFAKTDNSGDARVKLDQIDSDDNNNAGIDAKAKAIDNGSDALVEVTNSTATGNSPNAVVDANANTGSETETVSPAIP